MMLCVIGGMSVCACPWDRRACSSSQLAPGIASASKLAQQLQRVYSRHQPQGLFTGLTKNMCHAVLCCTTPHHPAHITGRRMPQTLYTATSLRSPLRAHTARWALQQSS